MSSVAQRPVESWNFQISGLDKIYEVDGRIVLEFTKLEEIQSFTKRLQAINLSFSKICEYMISPAQPVRCYFQLKGETRVEDLCKKIATLGDASLPLTNYVIVSI